MKIILTEKQIKILEEVQHFTTDEATNPKGNVLERIVYKICEDIKSRVAYGDYDEDVTEDGVGNVRIYFGKGEVREGIDYEYDFYTKYNSEIIRYDDAPNESEDGDEEFYKCEVSFSLLHDFITYKSDNTNNEIDIIKYNFRELDPKDSLYIGLERILGPLNSCL